MDILSFSNPIVLETEPAGNPGGNPLTGIKEPDLNPIGLTPDSDVADPTDSVDPIDPKESTEEGLDGTSEEESEEEYEPLYAAINELGDEGIFSEYPEGMDADTEMDAEAYKKFIKHNFELGQRAAREEVLADLSETALALIEYEKRGGTDSEEFIKSRLYRTEITSLDPANEAHQETIVREYYKSLGVAKKEIDETVEDLRTLGKLAKKATELKPALDEKAQKIASQKLEDQRQIQEYELKVKKQLEARVDTTLKLGKISGIPVSKEQAQFLKQSLLEDKIPVKIGYKKEPINVSASEAIVLYHKYNEKGSLETLMTSLLMMAYPDHVKEYLAKDVKTKAANKFMNDHKFSQAQKTGQSIQEPAAPKSKPQANGFIIKR